MSPEEIILIKELAIMGFCLGLFYIMMKGS